MAITCWHVGTAFIALLQGFRIPHLSRSANEDLDILTIAVRELQKMWASANVVAQGFERLRKPHPTLDLNGTDLRNAHNVSISKSSSVQAANGISSSANINAEDDFDWMRFFPFVSKSTGGIAESLVSGCELGTATRGFPSPNNELFHGTLLAQYQDLFDPFTDYTFTFPDMMFDAA